MISGTRTYKYLLFLIPGLLFILLEFGFGFRGLYGQDSHEYLRYSEACRLHILNGTPIGDFHWPKAYSVFGAWISFLGISPAWSLRIISLGAVLGILFFIRRIIQLLYQRDGTVYIILGAATQIYFVRAGIMVMTDALCAFFVLGVFYHYFKLIVEQKNRSLIWLLIFAVLAFFSRYASIPLLLFPVLHGAYRLVKSRNVLFQMGMLVLGAAAFVSLLFMNNNLLDHLGLVMREWSIGNMFSRSIGTEGYAEVHWVPNIIYIFGNFFHIGFLSIGIFLLPFYKSIQKPNRILIASLCVYLLFISGLATQNYRFLVLTHPLVLILLFPAYSSLWDWLKSKRFASVFLIGTVLFNSAFFIYSFKKTYEVFSVEREVSNALKELKYDGAIYTFYVDQSFNTYGIHNEVKNLWLEQYEDFKPGALVIFNESKFGEQWKGHTLMKNWENLNETHKLVQLDSLRSNWKIYRID